MVRPPLELIPFYGRLTPFVQRARLAAARPYLLADRRVLDVGCGLTSLPGSLPFYVGCDRNEAVLAENRRRFPEASLWAWDVGSEEPSAALLASGRFDVVLMLALLEHLSAPWEALRRAGVLLAPGGRLVATTPHPWGRIPLEAGAALGLLSPHADEEHETLLSRPALEEAGRRAGLKMVVYRRFLFGLNQLAVFERAAC
ncbi:MAG: class I SAM-dependent methyltransferase [Thermoanaerobaculia bacterium]